MPPAPAPAWSAPRDASSFGPECAQILGNTLSASSDEDCLYLNVWTPDADVKKAPVFVWIYGGGFIEGSGADLTYNGANVVAQTGSIVVTFNYRLGALGFLSHPALATAENVTTSPSQGLLDQQAALKWVQTNIASFGGDPANVTVAGESAGAISTCTHLVMPGSSGLFAHAVIESGLCVSFPLMFQPPAQANDQGNRLAAALGCTDPTAVLTCMQSANAQDVLTALPGRHALFGATGDSFSPVVDGAVLQQAPADAIKAGSFAKVPTIIGSNLNEGQLFGYLWGSPAPTPTDLRGSLGLLFTSSQVDTIAARYPVDTDAPTAFVDILSDVITCMARSTARLVSAGGAPTYLYQFTYPFQVPAFPGLTTTHSFEIPFVFGNGYEGSELSDADVAMSGTMQAYWFSFAKTGTPTGTIAWPAYIQGTDQDLKLDAPPTVATGLNGATCDFWDSMEP